jgi:hypothetical protein
MTLAEANVALRFNSIATAQFSANGDLCTGYVYAISTIHEEGSEPRTVVILRSERTGTTFQVRPEDARILRWRMLDYIVEDLGGEIGTEYADPYGSGRVQIK